MESTKVLLGGGGVDTSPPRRGLLLSLWAASAEESEPCADVASFHPGIESSFVLFPDFAHQIIH